MEKFFTTRKNWVDDTIAKYASDFSHAPAPLATSVRYTLLGESKRLRPILSLVVCEICGGSYADVEPAMVAIEYVHTYSLIHDDLPAMDNATTRRGQSANHIKWGEGIAILAGDALLTEAFVLLSSGEWSIDATRKISIINRLSKAIGIQGMVGGQAMDIELSDSVDTFEGQRVNIKKTAELIEASCAIGALCGGADDRYVDICATYGRMLGHLFQMTDDILDCAEDRSLIADLSAYRRECQEKVAATREVARRLAGQKLAITEDMGNKEGIAFLLDLPVRIFDRIDRGGSL